MCRVARSQQDFSNKKNSGKQDGGMELTMDWTHFGFVVSKVANLASVEHNPYGVAQRGHV